MPFAGRLRYFSQAWSQITSDNFVLSTINGYKIPFSKSPTQKSEPKASPVIDPGAMQTALKNVLEIGAVRKCKESKGQFISGIFLVPKSNGEMRLI